MTDWKRYCDDCTPGLSCQFCEPAVPDKLRKAMEAVAQSLLDDRYDSGTDHGHGYSDGLTEAAERIRAALAGGVR